MKKVIALILVILMSIMLLAGCSSSNEVAKLRNEVEGLKSELCELAECSSSNEVDELQKEVEELKSELSKVKDETSEKEPIIPDVESPEAPSESEVTEIKPSETTTNTVTSDMLDFLTIQLQSNHYEDWNSVAACDYATEQHLLKAAKKCATIQNVTWAKTIATSICANPAATGNVIKELSNSTSYSVWNIAAQSTHADEEALIAIAKKCATILNVTRAETIATSICANPAVTGNALKELANSKCTTVISMAHEKIESMQ